MCCRLPGTDTPDSCASSGNSCLHDRMHTCRGAHGEAAGGVRVLMKSLLALVPVRKRQVDLRRVRQRDARTWAHHQGSSLVLT